LLSSTARGGPAPARRRLGVLGWPVAHSRSPEIQNAALRAAGLSGWRYQLLPVPADLLEPLVHGLPQAGFRGANVTIPHKEPALALATAPTARALAIGAANTLVFEADGRIVADNTDAPALLEALPIEIAGASALVLGAGGSARAAVWALGAAGASEVRIWNRTAERARRLGHELGAVPVSVAEPADVLVNCTAVGLDGASSLEGLPISVRELGGFRCVVDLVYAGSETALVRAAREQGLPAVGGLELLIRQGALSFELFTGVPASLEAMRAAVAPGQPAAAPSGGYGASQ
jgi:shikimate dehydrogenase